MSEYQAERLIEQLAEIANLLRELMMHQIYPPAKANLNIGEKK